MRRRLGAFVIAALGATAGRAEAQAGPPVTTAILQTLNSIQTVANEINGKLNSIQVTIVTNETVCTGVSAQCNGSGHTFAAAAPDNHNPVAVILFVTRNGQPVLNLPASAFTFERKFTPAAGPGYGPCNDVVGGTPPPGDEVGCGPFTDSLFQDASDGVYAFYVHPTRSGREWHQGMYTFIVTVTDAGIEGRGLGKIVIPAPPAP
jgi:hypothetical protein